MENQNNIQYIGAGIALLLVGAVIGAFADPYLPAAVSNSQKGYQTGFSAAKQLVADSAIGAALRASTDIHSLSGTVTAIDGNHITLHSPSGDPFADKTLDDRTVAITGSTAIVELVQKDQKAFQTEMDEFIKGTQAASNKSLTPPSPSSEVASTAAAIKVGSVVTVSSSGDISVAKEFNADNIKLRGLLPTTNTKK